MARELKLKAVGGQDSIIYNPLGDGDGISLEATFTDEGYILTENIEMKMVSTSNKIEFRGEFTFLLNDVLLTDSDKERLNLSINLFRGDSLETDDRVYSAYYSNPLIVLSGEGYELIFSVNVIFEDRPKVPSCEDEVKYTIQIHCDGLNDGQNIKEYLTLLKYYLKAEEII